MAAVKLSILDLRSLTTGMLHGKMDGIYTSIEALVGEEGIMTHHIPSASNALLPFLKQRNLSDHFWDGKFDPSCEGEIEVDPLTKDELEIFWKDFNRLNAELMGFSIPVDS